VSDLLDADYDVVDGREVVIRLSRQQPGSPHLRICKYNAVFVENVIFKYVIRI